MANSPSCGLANRISLSAAPGALMFLWNQENVEPTITTRHRLTKGKRVIKIYRCEAIDALLLFHSFFFAHQELENCPDIVTRLVTQLPLFS